MLADRIARTTLGLADAVLRAAHLRNVLSSEPVEALALALDAVATKAELGDLENREVLVALVDALSDPMVADVVQHLREQAAGEQLLALDRLLRRPVTSARMGGSDRPRPPDYGYGRPLTLGERKSLARKPNRAMLERLMSDPHPDVIERLLVNPRLTEEDVMRIASRRPARPDVLAAIARSQRWVHRPRVRLSLLLNPDMPLDLAIPIAALLRRPELKLVAEYTYCSPALRSVCLEHFKRRVPLGEDGGEIH